MGHRQHLFRFYFRYFQGIRRWGKLFRLLTSQEFIFSVSSVSVKLIRTIFAAANAAAAHREGDFVRVVVADVVVADKARRNVVNSRFRWLLNVEKLSGLLFLFLLLLLALLLLLWVQQLLMYVTFGEVVTARPVVDAGANKIVTNAVSDIIKDNFRY